MVIELREKHGAQPIVQAIERYKVQLRAAIDRAQRRLAEFGRQYGITTASS